MCTVLSQSLRVSVEHSKEIQQKSPIVENDCICCAERKMIDRLLRESRRKGVKPHNFSRWVHRIYGDFLIIRNRKDGITGISLPCVLCLKAMERKNIQWTAYSSDGRWVRSGQDDDIPSSKPTSKQIRMLSFTPNTQRCLECA
jgi:hypothetical protein